MLRVVVADDSYLIRQAVTGLIADEPDLETVAVTEDLDTLLDAVAAHRPDVVVTDVRMPPTSSDEGIVAADRIRVGSPETGVVVLSQFVRHEYATRLFAGGSQGTGRTSSRTGSRRRGSSPTRSTRSPAAARWWTRSWSTRSSHAIHEVARGGSVVDPVVVDALIAGSASGAGVLDRPSPREREVLREMARGRNNAVVLFLTVLLVAAGARVRSKDVLQR